MLFRFENKFNCKSKNVVKPKKKTTTKNIKKKKKSFSSKLDKVLSMSEHFGITCSECKDNEECVQISENEFKCNSKDVVNPKKKTTTKNIQKKKKSLSRKLDKVLKIKENFGIKCNE